MRHALSQIEDNSVDGGVAGAIGRGNPYESRNGRVSYWGCWREGSVIGFAATFYRNYSSEPGAPFDLIGGMFTWVSQ